MAFQTPQGASSTTFNAPPTDGSLALVEMFDYNALHSPRHPLFRYESPDDGSVQDILWADAIPAFHKAARLVRSAISNGMGEASPVVAILASMDSLTFFVLMVAIMRAGCVPFPISTRNSPAGIANLLAKTDCKYWFVSDDATTQKLANVAVGQLPEHEIKNLAVPKFSDLFSAPTEDLLPPLGTIDLDEPCIVLHSSGSSSLPKPITLTQRMVLPYGRGPYFGEIDWCGEILSAHGLPMFHMMGFLSIPWTAMTGVTAAFFAPSDNLKPPVPSPPAVMAACIKSQSTIMLTVPAFLEAWSKNPASVEVLKGFKAVQVSGGPVQRETGDFLASHNINIVVAFGMTEIGVGTLIVTKQLRKEGWAWVQKSPHVDPVFVPVPDNNKIYRLIFKKCSTHYPAVINTTIDGVDAFDTNDLVIRHPTNPLLWMVHGRHDEQITHSTGEKTNPAPIEAILEQDPNIAKAVMFGRSRFQVGLLIMPSDPNAFDSRDAAQLAEFRNKIWDTVTKANESAPRQSRIFKEMIILSHPEKPFELTAKGSKRRQPILDAYETEITEAYTAVDTISRPEVGLPDVWSVDGVASFVRDIVQSVVDPQLGDNDDIFLHGGDSLSATSIRSSIQLAIRKSKQVPVSVTRALPPNFVFDFPTISKLTAFVYGVLLVSRSAFNGEVMSSDDDDEIFDWQSLNTTSTIVRLRTGQGEPPLIILHGVAGSIIHFKPFQENFRSALWAIQITSETPIASLQEQAAFYYKKIKEELPKGPYRLASFSASSFLLVLLVLMFEANGEEVTQMAMLDHFPTSVLPVIGDFKKVDANDPDVRNRFLERGFEIIDKQLRQDDGGLFPNQKEGADLIRDVSAGRSTNPTGKLRWERMKGTLLQMLEFLGELAGPETSNFTVEESMASLIRWMKVVKAPVSVYVASNGMVDCMPEEARPQWKELGVQECYPDAEVIHVKGGHFGILADGRLISSLQKGYL